MVKNTVNQEYVFINYFEVCFKRYLVIPQDYLNMSEGYIYGTNYKGCC